MVVDIAIILIVFLGTFIGYKKGFVKVAIKLGTFIVAFILASIFQASVGNFIGETLGIKNTIYVTIEDKLIEYTTPIEGKTKKEIDIPVLEKTINEINSAAEDKKIEKIEQWSNSISDFVIKGISFISIFLVVSILMWVIGLILDTVCKLPVLKALNGTLGAVTEFVLMLLRILIILAVISFLSPLEIIDVVTEYINESCITKWLYENNIIISILGRNLL